MPPERQQPDLWPCIRLHASGVRPPVGQMYPAHEARTVPESFPEEHSPGARDSTAARYAVGLYSKNSAHDPSVGRIFHISGCRGEGTNKSICPASYGKRNQKATSTLSKQIFKPMNVLVAQFPHIRLTGLEEGIINAYHRHPGSFCSLTRRKGIIK